MSSTPSWTLRREAIVDGRPSGSDHCGYIGHPKYRYVVTISNCTALNLHGWVIDNNAVHRLVKHVIKTFPAASCEILACNIATRLSRELPNGSIEVTLGDANGVTQITWGPQPCVGA